MSAVVRRLDSRGLTLILIEVCFGRVRRCSGPGGAAAWAGEVGWSARFVAMPNPCVEAFRRHRERQDAERVAAGATWHESGLVFTTPIGAPMEPAQRQQDLRWSLRS